MGIDFEKDAEPTVPEATNEDLQNISALCYQMIDAEQEVLDAEMQLKRAKAKFFDIAQKKLPEAMDAVGMTDFTLSDGTRLTVTHGVSVSIPADAKQEAWQWLRDNGHGDLIRPQTVTERIHPATLKAWWREQVEKGEVPPEDFFRGFAYQQAKLVRKK